MGIVGLKLLCDLTNFNSHKSLHKIQKTEQITRDFCCIFYSFVDFLTLNTLTQLYFKKSIHISDQYCFEKLIIIIIIYIYIAQTSI